MEKCNPFKKFSAVLSPELAPLNLTEKQEARVLTGLHELAAEAFTHEQNRVKCVEELKQLNLRLTKYKRLARAIKNIQENLEKALTICSQLPSSKWTGPAFEALLDGAKEMVGEASQNLENSRLFFVGFGTPTVKQLPKKLVRMEVRSEALKSMTELMKRWKKNRGDATFFPTYSLEAWLEDMGGTGLHELTAAFPLGHLRATAADHLLIAQAGSYLQKHTVARPALRLKIISKLFLAAFDQGGITTDMVKTVLDRAKRKPRKSSVSPHVSKITSRF